MTRAHVIGAGPNGLAAAIVLAQAGLSVDVYEAQAEPGGAARTMPLTLPGFLHDFGSAVLPMAAGSPFFNTLPLARHGLQWIQGDAPLAHPLDDGTAVMLEQSLADTARELALDGKPWQHLMQPIVAHWDDFIADAMSPLLRVPHHPLRMARFGMSAFQSARLLADNHFRGVRARALFAGLAAHSFMSFDRPLSAAIGLVLGAAAHAVGWPIPSGGSAAITRALVSHFESLGGALHVNSLIDARAFSDLNTDDSIILCDTTPRAVLSMAGDQVTSAFRRAVNKFELGPGVFKIDYALSEPVPWRAHECRRAITVHLGDRFEEIAAAEETVARGQCAERPFVLVAQPSLFDPARAPAGKHVLWAYCHVPNDSAFDMSVRIEAQIERFAPGFRDCVLARHISTPASLERMDANLVGGDISGGESTLRQFLFRPSLRNYATGTRGLYLCSSSTPPGGGVHGMCGFNAAALALRQSTNRSHG
jgi:phytoene dehydrogenase-like protein